MAIAWTDGREARPVAGDVCEDIDGGGDGLLDRWLSQGAPRLQLSSRPPPKGAREELEPIGDSVADAWFR